MDNAKLLDNAATGLTIAGIMLIAVAINLFQLGKIAQDKESAKSDGV